MSRRNKPMSLNEIKKMEIVCQLAAKVLQHAQKLVQPGYTTQQINDELHELTLSLGCESAPLNYHGFPKSICTSINDVVCHGVPSPTDILMPGDSVNIDVTLKKDGFFGDTSRTFFVGEVTDNAKRLADCAQKSMYAGIEAIKAGKFNTDVGRATLSVIKDMGFFPVLDIGGHGIGKAFHMDPFVPAHMNVPKERLIKNTCITVEPMVNETSSKYNTLKVPGSSIAAYKTIDGTLSAQFEHTILVTSAGYEILTEW